MFVMIPRISLLAVLFLVSDLLLLFPTNEARSFPYKVTHRGYERADDILEISMQFSEAPEYRNAFHCPVLGKNDVSLACNPSAVHIAMTIDSEYLRGSVASIHSILRHTSCPENLFFHLIASDSDSTFDAESGLTHTLESTFPSLHFKVYVFKESIVRNLISSSIRQALENPLNYARSYLADLLEPCVKRVIYLDSDTILVDDIQKLWRVSLSGKRVIAAPEYCHADITKYFTDEFWSDSELRKVFESEKSDNKACYFNTGVMVMDLERWREGGYTKEIERWMRVQKERRIYELGSLPPFLLVFGGRVEAIEHRWNQHGLGGDNVVNSCRSLHPGPVSLLHWSGKGKPWVRLDSYVPCPVDLLWAPYDLYKPHAQFHPPTLQQQ